MVIYEVGVGPLHLCRSRSHWEKDKCVLFEPLTSFYKGILKEASLYPNVQLHNIAIYDYDGTCDFIENDQLSFIRDINSPHIQFGYNTGYKTLCKCAKISRFDKGNIDLLLLDMEGAEWFALKHLVSRPAKIVIETELTTIYYNPFLKEIKDWMKTNGYRHTEQLGADAVWEKPS